MKKEARDLKSFFNPKSIAIVGASNHLHKVGGILMNKLKKFDGKVIPINPKHRILEGKKCYSSLLEYSGKIDLVVVAVPAKFVNSVLEDCGVKGIQNVIIISAGFSEQGNRKLENELINTIEKYNLNVLGPNCFGIANPFLKIDTTFANVSPKKGDIAFISQSGALASYAFDFVDAELSGFVSIGNMADLDFTDWVEYFNRDSKTKTIILYVEKIKDGKKFIDVCKNSAKEIIAIKAGKTREGSEATLSHTGSLATEYEIYKGAFKQARVKSASSMFSAFAHAKLKIKPKGNRVVIVTNAGGAGALMTDACIKQGLKIVKEPIDLLGTATAEDYKRVLVELKKKNFYDAVIVILTPQMMSQPEKTAEEIIKFSKTKSVVACFLGEISTSRACKILNKNDVLCLDRINEVAEVFGVM